MPSGRHVTEIAAVPVQWRDGQGDWHGYDFSLTTDGAGWVARPGKVVIDLPGQIGGPHDDPVRIGNGSGDVLTMAFLGEAGEGTVADDVATYRGVAEGVDLRLRAIPDGVKEDVVLHSADASRELSYRVTVSQDSALEKDVGGGLRVVRGEKTVFVIPAPTLIDDAGVAGFGGRFEIREAGERTWVVTTVLPQQWLNVPERAWPIVVDPTVQILSVESAPHRLWTATPGQTGQSGGLVSPAPIGS
jgi:hypothetical protein